MKNIFKLLLAVAIGLFFFSCRNDDAKAVYAGNGTNTLTADVTSLVLTKNNAANKAVTFTWSNPTNGFSGQINNVLQFAVSGTNFANPVNVTLPTNTMSITYTVQDLNSILLKLGLSFTSASAVDVRVSSAPLQDSPTSVNSNAATNSPAVKMTVTPYPLTAYMYMPGSYEGWDVPTANTLVSQTGNGIYIGYANFDAGGSFKLTADRSWTTNYGTNDGINLVTNGPNINNPGAGYYQITVDMNKNTIAMVPYSMGIVGDLNGWAAPDLAMTWNDAIHSWTYTGNFVAGGFKFRVNNDWSQPNYGGANGVIGKDNIPVTAGTHTVTFNPFAMTYKIQ